MADVEMSSFHDIEIGETFQETELDRKLAWQYMASSMANVSSRPVREDDEDGTPLIFLSSFTLNTGFNTTSAIRLGTVAKNTVLAAVEHNIFVGSTSDPAANLLPGGSSIVPSLWRLYGPYVTEYSTGGIAAQPYNHYSRLNISNNSGSNHTITIIRVYRYITNIGDSLT